MPTIKTTTAQTSRKRSTRSAALSSRVRKERSYRQRIARIDVWSVLKVSLCFYTATMLIAIVAMTVCWWLASAVGIINNIEKFLGTVFEIKDFSFVNLDVFVGLVMIGLVFVFIMTILSVIAASLYNIFSEAVGGIEVYIVEETAGAKV